MIIITRRLLDQIRQHALADYPNECCGVIVGTGEDEKRVLGCYKTRNMNKPRAKERYQIDAEELFQIDEQARANQLSIIGCYHSHPNYSACPSAYDVQSAWPGYSYLIISVDKDKNTPAKSWVLDEPGHQLIAEEIRIINHPQVEDYAS